MAKYIKREAALQVIDYAKQLTSEQIVRESGTYELLSDTGKACYDGIITALAMCKRLINEAVIAADVQPVKRGRWVYSERPEFGNPYGSYQCSECKHIVPYKENYCPNCGADMREANATKG